MPLTGLELILTIEGETLDLNTCIVSNFRRVLNMREGYLERSFTAELASGKKLEVNAIVSAALLMMKLEQSGTASLRLTLIHPSPLSLPLTAM